MAASYPASVRTFTPKANGNVITPAFFNDLQEEVEAIESGLLNGIDHILRPLTNASRDFGTPSFRWDQMFGTGLNISKASITADAQQIYSEVTWNNGAVTFVHTDYNIAADTASAGGSLLARWRIAGSVKASIRKDGRIFTASGLDIQAGVAAAMGTSDAFDLLLTRNNTEKVRIESARVLFQDSIAIGTNPASAGSGLRLPNAFGVFFRNGTNNADITAMLVDSSDNLVLRPGPGGQIQSHADGGSNLGSTTVRWGQFHLNNFIEGSEIADPAAPGADRGRLYFRDNGSAKTQLVVRFPTGAVEVIATEP